MEYTEDLTTWPTNVPNEICFSRRRLSWWSNGYASPVPEIEIAQRYLATSSEREDTRPGNKQPADLGSEMRRDAGGNLFSPYFSTQERIFFALCRYFADVLTDSFTMEARCKQRICRPIFL